MKEICRLLGSIVLLLAIAIFVLFKLNGMGFISGSLGKWTTNVVDHVIGIKDDTAEFLNEQGILKSKTAAPTAEPTATPQA